MSFGHFTVDEGVNPATGVRTQYVFEGDQVVCKKTYDAEPYIRRAQELRAQNEGQRWGNGKAVGVIPPWVQPQLEAIKDDKQREKATKQFFRENRVFLAYDAYLQ